MKPFPAFKTHEEARCFSCIAPLPGGKLVSNTGYAPGRFSQPCVRCGLRTFYDLDPFKPEGEPLPPMAA